MASSLSRRLLMQGMAAGSVTAALGGTAHAQDATPPAAATPAAATAGSSMTSTGSSGPITIFQAKKIVTLDPVMPEATHVAVRNGRILGAGNLGDLTGWGEYTVDTTWEHDDFSKEKIAATNAELVGERETVAEMLG